MKKTTIFLLLFFTTIIVRAQVGINTTIPNAQLDIRSSNQATPTNTDGVLIPKVDAFPATNPTAAQQGMLVYLTTTSGADLPGFYYWDNTTVDWKPITGTSVGTLDQAYDFGGAGNGKTIIADAGAVTIEGTDGLVSTGTFGVGATVPSIVGARLMWNPRKLAFRVGWATNEWDDINTGINSVSFGNSNYASGHTSTAFGTSNQALGVNSFAAGRNTITSGWFSTVFGRDTTSKSYGEVVFGIGNTDYSISTNGDSQFGTTNSADRLFVIGNAIDANNNLNVDNSERSDALVILKNGLTRLPSTTNAMITAADGKAVVTKEYLQSTTSGTLDQAYDFGGAGNGRTITADAGAVIINGTDGLVSTGTDGSGAVAPSGGGAKMIWNPRKSAFRAGRVTTNQWDDVNIGSYSVAFGDRSIASGSYSSAFGLLSIASGPNATAFGLGTSSASGSTFAAGFNTDADGYLSTVFGDSNAASSYGETVFGIGATTYTPSVNGALNFRTANATDRLFVIGNAIDANSNGFVENPERSDAMIVLKNGLTRLPSTTNAMINAADGKAVVTKEYLQSNTSGTLDQAYDFGGAGNGKTITADAGAVTIDGTDGLVSTGQLFSGIIAPAGAGTRMVWNPRKGAFRAGNVLGAEWDDTNMGSFSTAFGENTRASAPYSFSIGYANLASGQSSAAFGQSTTASGTYSATFGQQTIANGPNSAAFGRQSSASGLVSFSFGQNTGANASYSAAFGYWSSSSGESSFVAGRNSGASGFTSVCLGESNFADGSNSLATGEFNNASGSNTSIFGYSGTAFSFGETVLGIGATTYTPSTNGATQFRATNATDRLFVIGNAIDANNNDLVDATERNDALIVLKNGLTRLPSTTNAMITSADGKAVVTKEYLQSNNWSLTGNTGTNAATNFIGTTDNIDLVFRRGNIISGRLGDSNTFFGRNSGVVNTGTSNTFIGERAGIANASGSSNTFLGRLAGANGTSGNDNTYLGYAAGLNNTGNSNLMLGSFASQNTTGSFNVFLGSSAGSNNTTGARNTTIGFQSDLGAGNLTNATAIGNLAQVDTSNSLVLGSINGVNGSLVSTNVGIGTTSPLTRLDVVDENTTTSNLTYGNLHVRSNNAQNIDVGGAITLGGYNDDTILQPRVFGSVEGRKSNATTNNSSGYLIFKTNNAGILAERMRITNTGNIGIGTAVPGGLFELALDQGRKPGTSTWTIVSDQRLKTINGNYTKGLNEILQLNPIRFNYKNNDERTFEKEVLDTEFAGFIAQEVQPLFPDAVGTDADGFLNFNIHPILIASVNAIKQLNAKNQSLEEENQELKQQLELLLTQQKNQELLNKTIVERLSALETKN